MSPRLVRCLCDPLWNGGRGAMAACEKCQRAELHRLLLLRGLDVTPHPADDAWEALIDSYHRDAYDRAHAEAPGRDG